MVMIVAKTTETQYSVQIGSANKVRHVIGLKSYMSLFRCQFSELN